MNRTIITGVDFQPDGCVAVRYFNSDDVKANGAVRNFTVMVPGSNQYDDEIDAVRDAASELLADFLEDFAAMQSLEEAQLTNDEEDDDGDS